LVNTEINLHLRENILPITTILSFKINLQLAVLSIFVGNFKDVLIFRFENYVEFEFKKIFKKRLKVNTFLKRFLKIKQKSKQSPRLVA